MSGPDRLPDSGIYLGGTGERAPGYPSHRLDKPSAFLLSLSPELFAIHDDRHKRFFTAHHAAAEAQQYHTVLSYPREETDTQKEARESTMERARRIVQNPDYVESNMQNPNKNFSYNIQCMLPYRMRYMGVTLAV